MVTVLPVVRPRDGARQYHGLMAEAGMLKRWTRRGPDADGESPDRLARELNVSPLLARLLIDRGHADPADARTFLDPKLTDLHDPQAIPGLDPAARRIDRAVREGQPIVVYGDYDVDGVTAAAILWHTLRQAGGDVHTYVPHRIDEGYGLNCDAVLAIADRRLPGAPGATGAPGAPGAEGLSAQPLLVTVDCGITAVEPVRAARQRGMEVVITDHHEFDPAHLPDATAIVHPNLPQSQASADEGSPGHRPSPLGNPLCGAGVAFKLAWHLARLHCGTERVPSDFKSLLLDLVSLAALGTVADVVPLVGENRVIVRHGLGQLKRTRLAGVNALIDASRLRDEKIDSYHAGFVLGPRLNACGRMGHAAEAVRLLTLAQGDEAARIAQSLCRANDDRRSTEREIFQEARELVATLGYASSERRAIVVGKEGWHPGVIGIVASRMVETFHRPVVMLSYRSGGESGPDESHAPATTEALEAHGSARSVSGVSIHEALAHCSPMLRSWGGHAMAAGLRLAAADVDRFRERLIGFINQRLSPEELVGRLAIDAECRLGDIGVELAREVARLAPFGRENPMPVFVVRGATLHEPPRPMGRAGRHLSLTLRQGHAWQRAVWFNAGDLMDRLHAGQCYDLAFELHQSMWQGRPRAEMHVRDARPC